jgi:predicted anti-sigma-YlaC factor YlaD
MSCHETKTFIDAYLDGELDFVRNIELERHLNDCSSCAGVARDAANRATGGP